MICSQVHKPILPEGIASFLRPLFSRTVAMSIKLFPFLLHTTAATVMMYGYAHLPDVVANMPMANMKGGHFQFLTIQGYVCYCSH